ncbi:MAG: hypothetical protein LBR20_08310 [Propionibacteriaceae bacterium]|jgi:alternate signal-mediated exported protein|nr:hypothetical protein [Propionibacteriaceae bacterium]
MNNSKNTKAKGLIVGLAGAVLLMGGSTYALWSAEGTSEGGAITAGAMTISTDVASGIYDVSTDRKDSVQSGTGTDLSSLTALSSCLPSTTYYGHTTAAGSWNIVPGDSVMQVFPFKATMKGDNLVAKLTADFASLAITQETRNSISGTIKVFMGGEEVSSVDLVDALSTTSTNLGFFQAASQDYGTDDGKLPKLPETATNPNMCVAISLTWDSASTSQASSAAGTLGDTEVKGSKDMSADIVKIANGLKVSLVQSRDESEIDTWAKANINDWDEGESQFK